MNEGAPQDDASQPWPAARRGWLAVLLLALASIMSQFDRTVINLMVGPVKAAFDLDDTRFGAWMAQKALLPSSLIVNSWDVKKVESWLKRK